MGRWKMVRLGDVCEIVSGTTPKSTVEKYWNGTQNWVTPAELKEDTVEVIETDRKITELAIKESGLKPFPAGTVLLSSRAPIGKVAIAGTSMYCNQGFKNLVCSAHVVNKYLYWFLKGKTTYLNSLGRGATFKEISKAIVQSIELPLPPLDEQKRIAKNLDLASEIVKGYKEQLSALDKLVQSVFYEMFGDPVTNEKGWEVTKLSALGELNRGISKHRPRNAPELLGGNYPLIQTGEVSNSGLYITEYSNTYSDLGLKQSRLWSAGTLCITIAANIAQTAILAFDACFPDSVVGFISGQRTNQIFIHTWFGFFQRILEEQAPQVAQKNINLRILGALDVIVPPLSLQTRFASIVTEIEAHKEQVKQALTEAENLFHSLMQEYFE